LNELTSSHIVERKYRHKVMMIMMIIIIIMHFIVGDINKKLNTKTGEGKMQKEQTERKMASKKIR
jgi:hypothetical protein